MIQGAIFDLDGTLLDSMSIWDTIGEDYLRSLGIETRENLRETFKTFTLEQSAWYYREHYGVTLSVTEIIDGINDMVENYYIEIVPLKPGVKEFLTNLHNRGVKMCIATVTDRHLVEAALKRCGVREFFSEIFTCAQIGKSKEDPAIYHEALEHLGTEKTQTQWEYAIDPETAKNIRDDRAPEHEDSCSMCGKFCAVRSMNKALSGEYIDIL